MIINKVGIFNLCDDVIYNGSDDTDDEIESGECLARKAAILNCHSLSVVIILIAFALYHEIDIKVQNRMFYISTFTDYTYIFIFHLQ